MYEMGSEETEAVARVLRSGALFRHGTSPGGAETETQCLEREWAERFGVSHSLALTSGTAALIAGLVGIGIEPGDEVLVPGYTYVATALAPLAVGAVPVLVDVDSSLMMDPDDMRAKITPRTRAIIPVHVHGHVANMEAILAIARARGLDVIEDCAQCIGGEYRARPVGSLGRAGAFSFNFFKILSAGEGGMLTTADAGIIARARVYCDPSDEARWSDVAFDEVARFAGVTYRTDEIHAAILRVQLGRLETIRQRLRERWVRLRSLLQGTTSVELSPVHDEAGDCGTSVMLRFETGQRATAFVRSGIERGLPLVLTRDTGCHVYCNWDVLMQRRGAHHSAVDPLHITQAGRAQAYAPDMLPRTLAHLERTVLLNLDMAWTDGDLEEAVRAIGETHAAV
jgi:dTDP-4-amino-4,6-dideoxygalactose transaminase